MTKKLVVAIIHGIGDKPENFASNFIEKTKRQLATLNIDSNDIAFTPIYWTDIVEPKQQSYLNKATAQGNLDNHFLRNFVISALGDAVAYQKMGAGNNDTYSKVHQRIDDTFSALQADGVDGNTPLLVLAHSLGAHIMSNYIWDSQQNEQPEKTNLAQMKTLCGMVTFGCNIPLFTFALDEIHPIKFPASKLSAPLKEKSKWLNYYDPDDVLGYPLKAINEAYDDTVTADIAINVGSFLTSWNPMSHDAYWEDSNFVEPVSTFIASLITE